jgi:hypothetical protein
MGRGTGEQGGNPMAKTTKGGGEQGAKPKAKKAAKKKKK